MPEDSCTDRALFGGAISSTFPLRFQDVSNVRQVPDHQEVFVDPARDESLIIELLDLKVDVADSGSATWFLQDLANEQDAGGTTIIEQSAVFEAPGLCYRNMPAVISTAVGQMRSPVPLSAHRIVFLHVLHALSASANTLEIDLLAKELRDGTPRLLDLPEHIFSTRMRVVDNASQAVSKGRQGREAQNLVKVYLANLRLKEVGTDILVTAYEPLLINPLSESASTVGAGVAVPAAQSGIMSMAEVFKLAVSSFKVHDWSLFGTATRGVE